MRVGLQALTERKKEALRLLLGGDDAKSMARRLGLSVHTVNERLRDARRKLDVTSSREAARLLSESERVGPNFSADKELGMPGDVLGGPGEGRVGRRLSPAHRLAWLGGGMLIMSLMIATVVLSLLLSGGGAIDGAGARTSATVDKASGASQSAGLSSARGWVALLGKERWRAAATLFKSQITSAQWASMVRSVRRPLGPVSARRFQSVTRTNSLPNSPAGDYEVIEFRTTFAGESAAIETIVLIREQAGWKVAGYFIR